MVLENLEIVEIAQEEIEIINHQLKYNEYCELRSQESQMALQQLIELYPHTTQSTVFDQNNYIDQRFQTERINRDGYDSYLLLYNINGFYAHSLQFYNLFVDEK